MNVTSPAAMATLGGLLAAAVLWQSGLPTGLLALSSATAITARAAVPDVLAQIYLAFALEDEAAICDALAGAVSGNLVADRYLQRRGTQSLTMPKGATTITDVEIFETGPLAGSGGFRVAWRVVGKLRHVARIHERINL